MLDAWLGERDDLTVVGDANQTIYSFTGATPRYLLDFSRRFPDAAVVRAWRDLLHPDVIRPPLPADWRVEWDGHAALRLPDGDALVLEGTRGFDAPLQVHARQGGERLVRPGRSHSHTLKQALQELGVPPWERDRLPLLSGPDGELLAAGDLVHSAAFDAWRRERGARLSWGRATHAATTAAGN